MKLLKRFGIPVLLVAAVVYLMWPKAGDVSGSEARALVDKGALLLDVRTPGEFAGGHIEGAVNIPVQELGQRLAELGDKDRPIVVYCRSGKRSLQAALCLRSQGHTQVRHVHGGLALRPVAVGACDWA